MAKFDPIHNAVILDIETAGTAAGSPIHEISLYQTDTKRGYQFLMQPNFLIRTGMGEGSLTGAATTNIMGRDHKRLTTGGVDKFIDFFDLKFYSDTVEQKTSLREVAASLGGPDNKGYQINWGDTLIARSVYMDELAGAKGQIGAERDIATRAARRVEEMLRMGGTDAILKASKTAIEGKGGKRLDRKEIFKLIEKTDSFIYTNVIKPLQEGDQAIGRSVYPYLTKIFAQAGSEEEAAEMIRKSSLANISMLAKAKDVSMKALITNQPIPVSNFIGQAFSSTPGLAASAETTVKFGDLMADRAIWIANANFESKQFGAQVAVLEADLYERLKIGREKAARLGIDKLSTGDYLDELRKGIQKQELSFLRGFVGGGTSPYTADVFGISNPEIAKARAKASIKNTTTSWRGVYQAYVKHMRAGDVGDIIDITKAHQAYMIEFGGRSVEARKPLTLSMDISHRLYKAAEAMAQVSSDEFRPDATLRKHQDKILRALFEAESHVGIEDASKTEAYVLRKSYAMAGMYQQILEDPTKAKSLDFKTAGALGREAMMYNRLYNRIIPEVQEVQLEKRVISAFIDFFEQGQSEQTTGRRQRTSVDRLRQVLEEDGTLKKLEVSKMETAFPNRNIKGAEGKLRFQFTGKNEELLKLLRFLGEAETRGSGADYQPVVTLMKKRLGKESVGMDRDQLIRRFFDEILPRLGKHGALQKTESGITIDIGKLKGYEDQLRHSTNERIMRSLYNEEEYGNIRQAITDINEGKVDLKSQAVSVDPQPSPTVHGPSVGKAARENISAPMNEIEKAFLKSTEAEYAKVMKEAPSRLRAIQSSTSLKYISKEISLDLTKNMLKKAKVGYLAMAGLGAAGLFADATFSRGRDIGQRDGPDTLRTMNYQKWLRNQQEFYGNADPNTGEGMSHNGINSIMRKNNSDFGSPYQGMEYSNAVFEHQDLLRARENYSRTQYAKFHFTEEGSIGNIFAKIRMGSIKAILNERATAYNNYNLGGGERGIVSLAGLKKNQNLTKINLSDYKITVSDADTIVLNRRGPSNELTSFFGMNEQPIKIRLGGIDSPETAHGDRAAQPFAYEAKSALQAMVNRNENLSLYVDPSNITYGRQVGFLFGDRGENINLELVRKGFASYLPYRGKGVQQAYDEQIFGKVSKVAQGNDYAMWGTPYFQAYRDVSSASGKSITFNTLANLDKVVENSNLMSVYSLANTAQSMGMYNNAMQTEASAIGARISEVGFNKEKFEPVLAPGHTAPHKSYLLEMLTDLGGMIRNKGGKIDNKFKSKNVMHLNKSMAIDSTGATNNIYNKKRMRVTSMYKNRTGRKQRRRSLMASGQKNALRNMSASPIGHHRY